MKKNLFLTALLLLVFCLAGCAAPAREAAPVQTAGIETGRVWPGRDWQTAPPEQQGLDPKRLAGLREAVSALDLNLHSLLIVRGGKIVFEEYFSPYERDSKHELFSVTKSFIATLVGIAADRGAFPDLEKTVVSYFPGRAFAALDSRKSSMTVKDLLTMSSGLDWQEGDPTYRAMYYSRDWVQYVLDIPMAGDPGEAFRYCSGCSHLLSAILQEATGENPRDFAEKYLFEPIGLRSFDWETDSQGIPIGGWGLSLAPRDMARLGYLYLNGGSWNGQQVVSPEWVQASVSRQIETGDELGYGYQWWIYPSHGAYAALGLGGQTILVVPDLDLVIVTTAEMEGHEAIFKLVEEYILPIE
jgi:CubicO group peptidase (beta-lactamase class C family)